MWTIWKKCNDKWNTHLQLQIVKGQESSGKMHLVYGNHWTIYHCCIYLNPNNVTPVVKATIVTPQYPYTAKWKVCTEIMDNKAKILDGAFEDLTKQGN